MGRQRVIRRKGIERSSRTNPVRARVIEQITQRSMRLGLGMCQIGEGAEVVNNTLRLEIPNQMLLLRVWRALLVTVWLLMTD